MKDCSIYIHIPFCDHKCIYCDFYSIITTDNITHFLKALKREIDNYSLKYSDNRKIVSVFFGGGTPSLMDPDYLYEILIHLRKRFLVDESTEITMETNPGTVDDVKLKRFKDSGINRISIGIQSFDDNDLKFLTRIHDKKTAVETIYSAANVGFKNISIDLIFNLPNQSKEKWLDNLQTAVSLPVNHISAYSLILERGTILNKLVMDGKVKIQDEDYDAELYETTIDFLLKRGYYQYEVSNFAKPGFECIHNNAYWHHKEYLGFGPSAHSFMDNKRWWNFSSLKKYISEVKLNDNAIRNFEELTPEQLHDEYIMLALRSSGLDLTEYKKYFNNSWLEKNSSYFNLLKEKHLLTIENDKMKLTSQGYAVCDEILKNIL